MSGTQTSVNPDWRGKYHYILQWSAMWSLTMLKVNRGKDLKDLRPGDFVKRRDELKDYEFWIKEAEEGTSTDMDDEETDRGIIPYFQITEPKGSFPGYNPGKIFEAHLSRLPPDATSLFCTPRQLGPKLHDPHTTHLYAKQVLGKHTIASMVPKICEILHSPSHFTNQCLRATSLYALQRAARINNWQVEEVQKMSGHTSVKTIEKNYAISMESDKRADMMMAILQAARISRGEQFLTDTSQFRQDSSQFRQDFSKFRQDSSKFRTNSSQLRPDSSQPNKTENRNVYVPVPKSALSYTPMSETTAFFSASGKNSLVEDASESGGCDDSLGDSDYMS